MDEPLVPLGEIVATHGLLGWLKLNPFNPETTALKAGADEYMMKPFDGDILHSKFSEAGLI